jgi:hypothetical protein
MQFVKQSKSSMRKTKKLSIDQCCPRSDAALYIVNFYLYEILLKIYRFVDFTPKTSSEQELCQFENWNFALGLTCIGNKICSFYFFNYLKKYIIKQKMGWLLKTPQILSKKNRYHEKKSNFSVLKT